MAKTYPRQVRVYLSEEEFQNLEAYCKQRDWSRSKGARELFSKALNAEQRGRGSRALPGELNRTAPVTDPLMMNEEQRRLNTFKLDPNYNAPSAYGPGFDHWSAANRHHGARLGEAI